MAFRLPRLPFGWKEQPQLFERYWDEALSKIEVTLNAILDIPLIESAVAAAQAAATSAGASATTAQSSAAAAQSAIDDQRVATSLVNSYPSGFTPPLLSADSSGNVIIAAHTRTYGDSVMNPPVPVSGATLTTGAAAAAVVRVFYDDPTRAGGTVTYYFTVDPATYPAQTGNTHSVGAVTIPASGTNDGKPVTPPGYVEP